MALTQEQVDWWFSQNPDATAEDVAAAVQSIGGLEANAGLAGMLANRFSIAEPEVTNYYNTYVGATTPTTPAATTLTTPTTDTSTTLTTPTTNTSTVLDNIISTPTTQADLLSTLAAPADNINSNNGYVNPSTRLNQQYGVEVKPLEGDDIETQAAQLAEEYASWSRSADGRFMNFIRKDDGAILKQTPYTPGLSNSQLLKIGLSFVPGAAPFVAAYNALDAARRGDWTGAIIGGTGLVPGMENINTALRVGQAIDQDNPFGAVTALAGNADAQSFLGLGNVNIGGFTAKDVMAAGSLAQAASNNNYAGVLTSLGTLTGSTDTALAGRALALYTRLQNGDTRALTDAINLSNSISGSTTGATTGTDTSAAITTLSAEDLAELQPGERAAYDSGGVSGLAEFRRSMRALTSLTTSGRTGDDTGGGDITTTGTNISGLPTGVQLASTGDGVFRTDVGGVPTYAESSNASSVKAPLGYTLLSMSESDEKPAGSYYDITANAWFKPDTAVTNLTGDATIQADAALFNNSLGTLDQLDTTRTADDFASFLATIGITNPTQLTDSGLSNQDILDLINATNTTGTSTVTGGTGNDDTVLVTGGTGNDVITGGTGNDVVTGGTGNDGIPTVVVEACKDGKVRDPITGLCVLPTTTIDTITGGGGNDGIETVTIVDKKCPTGQGYDEVLKKCVPIETVTIVDKKCPPGQVYDEELKKCVPVADDSCPSGYERDKATGKCIPVVTIVDKKCPTGEVYNEELKKCVPIETDKCATGYEKVNGVCVPACQEGYSRDEATGKCIPVVTIVDKKCPTGQVYDEELKKCVPIETDECATGFHKDATGLCVPDDDGKCKTGYEKVNGTCVPVCKEGYIRNLATGVCEKAVTPCPAGQTRNAEGKCVPIVVTPPVTCQPGYERINGVCVPVCQPGYVRIDGVCKKIPTEVITTMPVSGIAESGEKTDPIYAGGMNSFNLLATLQDLLAEEAPKKDDKKSKDKTKMATGGHLDDLLAEQMTVDDLLKLLR